MRFLRQKTDSMLITSIALLLLTCTAIRTSVCVISSIPSSLSELPLDGHLSFDELHHVAKDFGNRFQFLPSAILYPKSVSDIALMIEHVWEMGPYSGLTVAARGHGHSLQGQSQTHQGIVINMESLKNRQMKVHRGESPFVDVSGGELWINVLRESLKYGLAPKSWTDYLHLTVGGTLSNGVILLNLTAGKGEVVRCSEKQNEDLFHGVLGGLGQFGIITQARISLIILVLLSREQSQMLLENQRPAA